MTAALTIRACQADDLERVAALFTAAVHGLAAQHYNERQCHAWAPLSPDLSRWRERLAGLTTLLALRDGTLAGFIAYAADGYIDLLFTHPDAARCGVATALYQHAEAELRSSGCTELYTEASLAGRPGFARWGFEVSEEQHAEFGGQMFLRYEMRKQLAAADEQL